jgi:hypothetical protein
MPLAQIDFRCDAGADWQRLIRLRDIGTGMLCGLDDAVMEIRNANFQLVLRLDAASGRCAIQYDRATIALHISSEDSLAAFFRGNFPGTYQAVGIWGIGRSYIYDLFVTYTAGAQDRIMKGFFYVDPNVTRFPPQPANPLLLGVP